jgi:hypothetical protein
MDGHPKLLWKQLSNQTQTQIKMKVFKIKGSTEGMLISVGIVALSAKEAVDQFKYKVGEIVHQVDCLGKATASALQGEVVYL